FDVSDFDNSKTLVSKSANAVSNVFSLAYDAASGELFWPDLTSRSIVRGFPDDSLFVRQFLGETATPSLVFIDPRMGHMYWGGFREDRIFRSNLDGTDQMVVVEENVENPYGLAISFEQNLLFWSDVDLEKIFVSGLDGSNVRELWSFPPRSISLRIVVHEGNRELIWADDVNGTLEAIGFDGSNHRKLYDGGRDVNPMGLALDEENGILYWTDYVKGTINRLDLGSLSNEELQGGFREPIYLALADKGTTSSNTADFSTIALSISPNPSKGRLSVWVDGLSGSDGVLEIHNRDGKLLRSLPMPSSRLEVDASDLPSGWYICAYRNGSHSIQSQFVIL
ncbi:MAG: T9SS type A sorting domain-containing protein, partial [Bacteroidota bacterium]